MKVVFLHPPLYPVNHDFFNILGESIDLSVYCFGEYPRLHKEWNIDKFYNDTSRKYKIKKFGKGAISFKTQLNPKFLLDLKKDNPDFVISIAFWLPSLYSSLLKMFFSYKFLILTDAIYETEKSISQVKLFLRKIMSERTDMFLCASDKTMQYVNELNNSNEKVLLFQSIDSIKWKKDLEKIALKEELCLKHKISSNKYILLGVGALNTNKNWISIINQIENLENAIFVLVGDGDGKSKIMKYIKENKLENSIYVVGRKGKEELQEYYKMADMFAFPTLLDTFGYVVLEALSSNLPVLCSKNSGVSTIIKDGYNGFLIEPNEDISSIYQVIIEDLEFFKNNAKKSVENLTLENKSSELISMLEGLRK